MAMQRALLKTLEAQDDDVEPATLACRSSGDASTGILFLVDQLTELGGGERMLFILASELKKRGYRTYVITFREGVSAEAYTLCDHIRVLPLHSCFSLHAGSAALQMRSFIKRKKIDIVQTCFESADLFGALVARLSGVRTIISSRRDTGFLRSPKHRLAYRLMRGVHTAVIAVSEEVRTLHMQQDHLKADRIVTVHNGINLDRFTSPAYPRLFSASLGLPGDGPIVTTVANIKHWKGVDVFLEAAALVHRDHPTASFAIAGDWTDLALLARLRSQARRLNIERLVHFLGPVMKVQELLFASDVFVLLSRSEGFPNVVIEAMAAGLPVVATAVGGTPEAVIDKDTGYLVGNEDHFSAAARIGLLLAKPEFARSMGTRGRCRVETSFLLEQMITKHCEVYRAFSSPAV